MSGSMRTNLPLKMAPSDMTESFLAGMKGLFEEHYVEIPEEKYDVLEYGRKT